jgi:hypothetical protein
VNSFKLRCSGCCLVLPASPASHQQSHKGPHRSGQAHQSLPHPSLPSKRCPMGSLGDPPEGDKRPGRLQQRP